MANEDKGGKKARDSGLLVTSSHFSGVQLAVIISCLLNIEFRYKTNADRKKKLIMDERNKIIYLYFCELFLYQKFDFNHHRKTDVI